MWSGVPGKWSLPGGMWGNQFIHHSEMKWIVRLHIGGAFPGFCHQKTTTKWEGGGVFNHQLVPCCWKHMMQLLVGMV